MQLGIHDERTRIVIYLPYNTPAEARAVTRVLDYLKAKREKPTGKGRITGFTQTRLLPAPFEGWWWSESRGEWVADILVLIMIDHEFRITNLQFPQEIDEMKQTIAQFYAEEGSPQEEIWLVTHPVWRYD